MYKIQANKSGSRSISIEESHLETIKEYSLLESLVDSHGIIDEEVLDKLKYNIRALLENDHSDKALLDLCLDVVYNSDMKAYGLSNLIELYRQWNSTT
jgi:hypothetical protein